MRQQSASANDYGYASGIDPTANSLAIPGAYACELITSSRAGQWGVDLSPIWGQDPLDSRVRLNVPVRRGVSPHFFRGEGGEVAEKGAGLTPAPSVPDTFNRTLDSPSSESRRFTQVGVGDGGLESQRGPGVASGFPARSASALARLLRLTCLTGPWGSACTHVSAAAGSSKAQTFTRPWAAAA
jgi:hypothetical protein